MELSKFFKNWKNQKKKRKILDLLWERLLKIIEQKLLDNEKLVPFLYVIKFNRLNISRLFKSSQLKLVYKLIDLKVYGVEQVLLKNKYSKIEFSKRKVHQLFDDRILSSSMDYMVHKCLFIIIDFHSQKKF